MYGFNTYQYLALNEFANKNYVKLKLMAQNSSLFCVKRE